MDPVARIKEYLDRIEDIAFLERTLDEVPLADLFRALLHLLHSPSEDDVARSDLFIRDVMCRTKPKNRAFLEGLVEAGIPAAYERNVFVRNSWIRKTAISTLTISGSWWSDQSLREALAFLEANDPLLLPAAMRDKMWRGGWKDWGLPNRLFNSSDFLVRWAVLHLLSECCVLFPLPDNETVAHTKSIVSKLERDENASVAAEADFLRRQIDYFEIMPTLAKPEKRKASKSLEKSAPKFRFAHLQLRVGNELKPDFDIAELHKYVQSLALF